MQFDPAFGGVGCGTPGGAWAETVLLSFGSGSDGDGPGYGALIIDAAGNLYGTTSLGGARGCYYGSCGTIFKVAPDGTERVLYALKGGSDGGTPLGGPDRRRVGQSLRHDERWRRNVRLLPLW